MIRLINENAITDLRKELQNVDLTKLSDRKAIDYYNRNYSYSGYGRPKEYRGEPKFSDKTVKEKLVDWVEKLLKDTHFDFNTQDLNLVRIAKPKGPTIAKRSPNMLIGISTKNGDAVMVGKDTFYGYFNGNMGAGRHNRWDKRAPDNPIPTYDYKTNQASLRDTWDVLDLWFEIVEGADYTPRSEINKGRKEDPLIDYDRTVGNVDHNFGMRRGIFYSEIDLYDPEEARRKYARRLKQNKACKQYEEILSDVEDINNRIKSIDFGHPILGGGTKYDERIVRNLRSEYSGGLKYYLDHLEQDIEEGREWSIKTYEERCRKAMQIVDRILTNDFGV